MENHHHFYIRCQKIVKKTNFWYEISEKNWGIFLTTYFFLVISYQKLVFLTILWHGIKKLMRYPPCINLSHVWKLLKRPTFDMKSLKKNRGRKNTIILLKKHLFWLKMTVFAQNHPFRLWNRQFYAKIDRFWTKIDEFGHLHIRFPNCTSQTAHFEEKTPQKWINYWTLMSMSLL